MLTKEDAKMAQGLAICGMVALHLFCRLGDLPYTPLIYIGEVPLVYYIGLFGDFCVPIYCFCSGYAQLYLSEKERENYRKNSLKRAGKFISHYWMVVILVAMAGLIVRTDEMIPGNIETFLGNIFLYGLSYNGAWWFVVTYLFLLLTMPIFRKLVNTTNIVITLLISGFVYLCAYIFRFVYIIDISNPMVSWCWNQLILLGTSQIGFVVGMLFYKYKIIEKINKQLHSKAVSGVLIIGLPILMFVFHAIEQSLIVAPFTGIITLVCFHLWKKPKWIRECFLFLGRHSTNIWLIHMFFYLCLFENLVYRARYPFLIFGLMLLVCVLVSSAINHIEKVLGSCWRKINAKS